MQGTEQQTPSNDHYAADRVRSGPDVDLRLVGWRHVLWRLTWWLRWYVRSFPLVRGRGVVLRGLVTPILPKEGRFCVSMSNGYVLELGYRERIGIRFAVHGDFERDERAALIGRVRAGTVAIDVGANIGLYTLELSKAVGSKGSVTAIEPWPENVSRLGQTIARNDIQNVRVLSCAVGSKPAVVAMYGGGDPAYVSSLPMKGRDAFTTVLNITQDTLDNIWVEAGRPTVSVLKVDVEGAELEVLMGAQQMMESCHPTLLCEANSIEHLHRLSDYLRVRGYDVYQPHGFERWNYLFVFRKTSSAEEIRS